MAASGDADAGNMGDSLLPDIEVGAAHVAGTLRYWLAREAVRHGELQLGWQITTLNGLMGRAQAILGWSVSISLALAAAIGSISHLATAPPPITHAAVDGLSPVVVPMSVAGLSTILAALACIPVLWPSKWRAPGLDPIRVLQETLETELETLEAWALGYDDAVTRNSTGLDMLERWLRAAWFFFVLSPIAGILTYFLI